MRYLWRQNRLDHQNNVNRQ